MPAKYEVEKNEESILIIYLVNLYVNNRKKGVSPM